jgi:hypothetical protein
VQARAHSADGHERAPRNLKPVEHDLPAMRLMRGTHTPADLAEHDQVRAAASTDLDALLAKLEPPS